MTRGKWGGEEDGVERQWGRCKFRADMGEGEVGIKEKAYIERDTDNGG